jgi:hypothetical protein
MLRMVHDFLLFVKIMFQHKNASKKGALIARKRETIQIVTVTNAAINHMWHHFTLILYRDLILNHESVSFKLSNSEASLLTFCIISLL